jgi:hypothetical protein
MTNTFHNNIYTPDNIVGSINHKYISNENLDTADELIKLNGSYKNLQLLYINQLERNQDLKDHIKRL